MSDAGWTGDVEEADEEDEEAEAEEVSESESTSAQAVQSVSEMESSSNEEESAENDVESESGTSDGPPTPADSVSPSDAAQWDRRWKILVWGPPKLFKTHFSYTMPEPIAFLDLEGKADDIASKFEDREVQIWQPKRMEAEPNTKFRRAKKALDQAMEWLDWYRENEDRRGTVVVDSMTLLWEWAQIHHKIENYPVKAEEQGLENIELSANFNSSRESDWAAVKGYHNREFRERVTDSQYHFCWTAMERESFEETFEDEENRRFMEPKGEPDNEYKADTVIRARKDKDRGKVGDLVGSNTTDNVFVGLKRPTFPKVEKAIGEIAAAEASDESVDRSELASRIGAEAIINHDPQVYIQ